MARAKDQKRWRDNSNRKRIEAYLPAETAAVLDRLAAERGQSRAMVIAALVDGQKATVDQRSLARLNRGIDKPRSDVNDQASTSEADSSPAANSQARDYAFRRPATEAEKKYEWIVVANGEPLAGVKRDARGGWRGGFPKHRFSGAHVTSARAKPWRENYWIGLNSTGRRPSRCFPNTVSSGPPDRHASLRCRAEHAR